MADKRIQQYPDKNNPSSSDYILIADSQDIDVNGFRKYKKIKISALDNIVITNAEDIERLDLIQLLNDNDAVIGRFYRITDSQIGEPILVQAVALNMISEMSVSGDDGIVYFYDIITDTRTNIQHVEINGTGFVKANGTTITYDNSTYLTNINGITAGGELSGTYPNPSLSNNAVTGKVLTGLSISGSSITSTDSILTSLGKLQNQINSLVGGVKYQGTWNASTNTPTLVSSVGTSGFYYVVDVAGSTNLNGITDWKVGDWAIFNGTTWQKVDNTDSVISVNGYTGAVTLTTSDIAEGTNLYYTDARVRQAISESIVGINYDNNTGVFSLASGYVIPTTTEQSNWNTAYNSRISSLTTVGNSGAATLINNVLNIPNYTTGLTSVGVTMPSAFSVANSPLTSNGTINITGAGNATQYVRGDGVLATLPTNGSGGGASVSYYLNGSVNQGTIGGVTYYEMNKTPIIGGGTDFTRNTNGYIASFLTDANDPALLTIPAGNWNFETYFSVSSGGGSPTFYIELYKYDGTTFSLIASNSGSPKLINDGPSIEAYFSALAVPQTTLALTDRLAIRIYVSTAGRTIELHTENSHLCQVITTFTTGLNALNGLTSQVQYFAIGTGGTDFNISSSSQTHTFNLPTASATIRGALSSTDWATFNAKQDANSNLASLSNLIYASNSFVKMTGANTFSLDTNTYLTANQTITISGEASGSGATSITLSLDNNSVTGKVLNGLSISGGSVVSTDSILVGIGKLQNQVNALAGGVNYQGTWNASTNTPSLTSSVGVKGYYYVVSVAGSTNLDGITDWKLGDWAIFNGSTWQKVDNTDAVISVNGYTGAVTLTKSDVGLGNVENTALSTWAGSTNITTLGTIGTGVWQGTAIADAYIASSSTWNAKIGGSGTNGTFPIFTSSGTISDSNITQVGLQIIYTNRDLQILSSTPLLWYEDSTTSDTGFFTYANAGVFAIAKASTAGSNIGDILRLDRATGAVSIVDTPTTSAGTFDLITRNTSTGVLEKVASNYYATAGSISGTTGKLAKFTSSGAVGDSIVTESSNGITTSINQSASTTLVVVENTNNTSGTARASLRSISGTVTSELLSISGFGLFLGTSSNHRVSLMMNGSEYLGINATNGRIQTNQANDTGESFIVGGSARVNGDTEINSGELFIRASTTESSGYQLNALTMGYNVAGAYGWITAGGASSRTDLWLNRGGGAVYTGANFYTGGSLGIGGINTDSLLTINGTAGTSHERFREGSTTIGFVGGANGIITGHNGKLALRGESGLVLSGQGNSADLIISNTGAATFSSSVTATSLRAVSGGVLALNRPDNGANSEIYTNSSNQLILSSAIGGIITLGTNTLIGTTTDNGVDKLQVNGSISTASLTGFRLLSGGDTLFSLGYSGGTLLNRLTGTNFFIAENGSPQLTIASGGAATFSSSITWGSASGQYMYAGGASHIFAYSNSTSNYLYSGGGGGFNINNAADSVVLMRVTDAGNVGIGTTSPAYKLDVNGAIAIGNAVTTSVSTPSTHKVEIVIGGVTYYLLATT